MSINGPFGVGKSTAARLLVNKLPRSSLYDPEIIGGVLDKVFYPFTKVEDYQDYALWRKLVVGCARLWRTASGRTLVIPMTVWRRDVFEYIVGGLRRIDRDLSCLKLTAPEEVLMDRIASDTEDREAYSWRASHMGVCLDALRDPAFGTEIRTDSLAPVEVAEKILESLPMHTGGNSK